METTVMTVNERKNEIIPYNHEEHVAKMKRDIEYIRGKNAEYALRLGKDLIIAKENVTHGKWLETLEELDFTPRAAERLMKIAETFGDNPELIEGMSQRRAYAFTTLPDESLIQLKHDGIVMLPDGTTFTLAEFSEMNGKQFDNQLLNLRNQKNKELRDWKDKAINANIEMERMKKQSEEREDFVSKLMADKDMAFAEKIGKLNALIAEIEGEKNANRMELMKKSQKEFLEQEVIDSLENAKEAIADIFFKISNVQTGYHGKLRAELLGFFEWSREVLSSRNINFDRFLEEEEN